MDAVAAQECDVGGNAFKQQSAQWIDERVLHWAERAASDDDSEARNGPLQLKGDIQRGGENDHVLEVLAGNQGTGDCGRRRPYIENDGLPRRDKIGGGAPNCLFLSRVGSL